MFELAISFLIVVLVFLINNYWFSLFGLVILLVLIVSGTYSMFFGAPFVASSKKRVESMLSLAGLKKSDLVVELGCGDGRIIHQAADRGVKKAIGYEYSIPTFFYALLQKRQNKGKAEIKFGNFWKQDLLKYDVFICFLLDRAMKRFETEIWPKLKKGTRMVSNEFEMINVKPARQEGRVFLYIKK